jgi:tetratricopeptide (TPR) repeat protein
MRRTTVTALLALVSVLAATASPAPVDLWFQRGNEAYEEQQYDSAGAYYRKIIDAGVHNSAVYYNLANAYFRQHEKGRAILNYERAKKLAPNDPDIAANLKFARMHIVDRVPAPERSLFESILWHLHRLLPLGMQLWVLLALLFLLAALYAIGLFVSHNARLWLIYLGSLVAVVVVFVGISSGLKIYEAERVDYAVVLESAIDARNQPEGRTVLFTVHEGTKFRVRKRSGDWWLVSLPNGVSGWVASSALETI